jgi:catechol 2,3-dioxygenase-like lactoylglutathione lyase family enzyme
VLGLPEVGRFPGYEILFLQSGGTTIELTGCEPTVEPRGQGWNHLALEVADIERAVALLMERGVSLESGPAGFPPEEPQAYSAFFRDPDGNLLELYEPIGARYPQANGHG